MTYLIWGTLYHFANHTKWGLTLPIWIIVIITLSYLIIGTIISGLEYRRGKEKIKWDGCAVAAAITIPAPHGSKCSSPNALKSDAWRCIGPGIPVRDLKRFAGTALSIDGIRGCSTGRGSIR